LKQSMRRLLPLLALLAIAAAAGLTETQVRAFVVQQERAWNAGRLDAYFTAFVPTATFTDRAYVGDKPVVVYGTSSLAQARAQTRRSAAKVTETANLLAVQISRDSRSARVITLERMTSTEKGRVRQLCAVRSQRLVLSGSRIRSEGQTDTFLGCPLVARVTVGFLKAVAAR
jgi:hypothetical protein